MSRRVGVTLLGLVFLLAGAGCGSGHTLFAPVDDRAAVFWDRQDTQSAALMRELVETFNASSGLLPIRWEHAGGYAEIFRKVSAGIQAGLLPAMAVSYESMTSEYIAAGAAVPLERWIHDPVRGLSEKDLADFFPAALESNRYAAHGNRMYSFPLAKSVLVMYCNREVTRRAGVERSPDTWKAFLEACRAVRAVTGKPALAMVPDCSTFSGMVFSMGGDVYDGQRLLYDGPESMAILDLLEVMVREDLLFMASPGTFDDNIALVKGDAAFVLRSSSSRAYLLRVAGDQAAGLLDISPIPQKDPRHPATVLFGPNVTLFAVPEEQQAAAWSFVRWFTEPEQSARWAVATGYIPVRHSAMEHPLIREAWAQWPPNRVPYECMRYARPEPNVDGWQQVRVLVERALVEVMSGTRTARDAAEWLQREGTRALERAVRAEGRTAGT